MSMLDISVAYNRFRFLGQEFLTWLWYQISTHKYKEIASVEYDTNLFIGDRTVLENRYTQNLETITIKGDQADLKEGMVALSKGALVAELGVILERDGHRWFFTLKGENLSVTNLKTPGTGAPTVTEEIDGTVLEKIHLFESVFKLIDSLYRQFFEQRIGSSWENQIQPAMAKWVTKGRQKPN